jgi:parvulin-like peptidyl-prolyl isomerase
LKKGADIKSLAKKFSVSAEASIGGDTGWIPQGVLDVYDKAFKMPKGSRSRVLKSPYGYHIFRVIDKKKARLLPLSEAKESIRRILLADRDQATYASWLEKQMRSIRVFRNDEAISSIRIETLEE